jgi:hypothetical protein
MHQFNYSLFSYLDFSMRSLSIADLHNSFISSMKAGFFL